MREIPSTPEGESETLLTGPAGTPPPAPESGRPAPPERGAGALLDRIRALDRAPVLQLLAYYALLVGVGSLLMALFPMAREAFVEPGALTSVGDGAGILRGEPVVGMEEPSDGALALSLRRIATTLLVVLGALALVVPVAWVYMRTKRFRYDPALVRSVIILPIVVAGIAMVVKDSLALAFSLAGIVAAVRFRNTLKDPRDAVYIFLVIGIGLSAGVQVLDVALVMSLIFNLVVLLLWRYNIGSVYSGRYARTGVLSVGDPGLLRAQTPEARREVRARVLEQARKMKADAILLVHSEDAELARHTVQEVLGETAKEWRLAGITPGTRGVSTLEYVLRLKKKASAPALLGALDERWSAQVDAVEYVPFRKRTRKRKKKEPSIIREADTRE
jgi:hypothetical protein